MYASTFSEQMDNLEIFSCETKLHFHYRNIITTSGRTSIDNPQTSAERQAQSGGWNRTASPARRHLTTTAFALTMPIHDRRQAMQ